MGYGIKFIGLLVYWFISFTLNSFASDIKQPNVAGQFYPANQSELTSVIDKFFNNVNPESLNGQIFALLSPHAGYEFSGEVAAYGYKLIKDKPYKTIIIIGPSHYYGFNGVSVFPDGVFKTPLGDIEVDRDFTKKILGKDNEIFFEARAFEREHSLEVQLPFLQKALPANLYGWKIVPIVMGDCNFLTCKKLAGLLKEAIGDRQDVLVIASTDMYHGHDYEEAEAIDKETISYLENMDEEGLYYGLREGKLQLCGGLPVVVTLILSKDLGHKTIKLLKHTNSAEVTGKKIKGVWTVGYSSFVVDALDNPAVNHPESNRGIEELKGEEMNLTIAQKKKLLEIARNSIQTYLKTGKKLEVTETDPIISKEMGAFVTLHKNGQLRGCIGNLVGSQPLFLTIRDMAVGAAVGDPRFPPVELKELPDLEIEISALSPLEKVDSAEKIKLGIHGVLVKRGFRSGVFLPQVATETGWTKEEFLSNLCMHKAGLSSDAWKDKATELYIFSASIFSEKEIKPE